MNIGNTTMDTLSILERLESAGFDRDKATVLAKEISHAYDYEHHILATKEDIETLKSETNSEFSLLRRDIDSLKITMMHTIKETELRMLNRLGVIIFLSITAGPAALSWISKLIEMASR
jgi:hypothetical protein